MWQKECWKNHANGLKRKYSSGKADSSFFEAIYPYLYIFNQQSLFRDLEFQ